MKIKTTLIASILLSSQIVAAQKGVLPTKDSSDDFDFAPKKLIEKCNKGHLPSCNNLGLLYKDGNSTLKKNKNKAIRLFTKVCNKGNLYGCENLGFLYYQSHDKGDYKKAAPILKKVCDSNIHTACVALGYMHYMGLGVKKDRAKTKTLYKKACDAGLSKGCQTLKLLEKDKK